MDKIKTTPIAALRDNYIWTMVDNQSNAVIVDPGEAEPVINYLKQNQLRLIGILITHHHWDHTNGVNAILKYQDVPVFGSMNNNNPAINRPVQESDIIKIDHFPQQWHVLEIPGHTLDHVAYYANETLFTGDTLFAAGCGRLFEGTAEQMLNSLQKLQHFPDTTQLYCGHEYTLKNLQFAKIVEPHNSLIVERIKKIEHLYSQKIPSLPVTLAEEKATNPFLRITETEIIENVSHYVGKKLHHPLEVFTGLRKWKDNF